MAAMFNDPYLNRVLVVDDDELVLSVLKEQLPQLGYSVTAVNHPQLALQHLQTENYSVILSDFAMPDMNGLALFKKVKETHPDTSRLLLSSGVSMLELSQALSEAVIYRHVSKPWLKEDLQEALANGIERYSLIKENEMLQARNITLSQQMASGAAATPGAPSATGASGAAAVASAEGEDLALQSFNKMLYTFHPNLGNTAQRALAICKTLGEILELDSKDFRALTLAAQLHDVGLMNNEIGVVRRWLRDPAKCTDEELVEIKRHSLVSEEMLQFHPGFADALSVIRSHHENWDGTGYPDKLKGETIPRLARLLAPVIYFCNQNAASVQLFAIMETMAEHAFDPDALRALAKAVPMTKIPKGEREVLLIELKAGMTLARDIVNSNGMKLLPKGRELNDGAINKIWSINRVTPINPLCLVFC